MHREEPKQSDRIAFTVRHLIEETGANNILSKYGCCCFLFFPSEVSLSEQLVVVSASSNYCILNYAA